MNGALVLKPSRRIDSSNAKAFKNDASRPLYNGPKRTVINVTDLDFISSKGQRAILATRKRSKLAGGSLTVVCARDGVRRAFVVSGFDSAFGLRNNVTKAISALT